MGSRDVMDPLRRVKRGDVGITTSEPISSEVIKRGSDKIIIGLIRGIHNGHGSVKSEKRRFNRRILFCKLVR